MKWEPLISKGALRVMNLGRNVKMVNLPERERIKFWDQLRSEFFEDDDLKDELNITRNFD